MKLCHFSPLCPSPLLHVPSRETRHQRSQHKRLICTQVLVKVCHPTHFPVGTLCTIVHQSLLNLLASHRATFKIVPLHAPSNSQISRTRARLSIPSQRRGAIITSQILCVTLLIEFREIHKQRLSGRFCNFLHLSHQRP